MSGLPIIRQKIPATTLAAKAIKLALIGPTFFFVANAKTNSAIKLKTNEMNTTSTVLWRSRKPVKATT
ncbi:MAG TPA: hypothetical protein VGC26_04855 [Afipia sp.]